MPDGFFDLLLSFDVERIGLEERHLAFALQACRFLHGLELVQEFAEASRIILRCVGEIGVGLCALSGESARGVSLANMASRRRRGSLTRRNSAINLGSPMTCRRIVSASCSTFLCRCETNVSFGNSNGERPLSKKNSPARNRRIGVRICALLPQEEHVVRLDAIGLRNQGCSARNLTRVYTRRLVSAPRASLSRQSDAGH